jgi:hypothetical protein
MNELVKHALPNNNDLIIGRSQSCSYNLKEIFIARSPIKLLLLGGVLPIVSYCLGPKAAAPNQTIHTIHTINYTNYVQTIYKLVRTVSVRKQQLQILDPLRVREVDLLEHVHAVVWKIVLLLPLHDATALQTWRTQSRNVYTISYNISYNLLYNLVPSHVNLYSRVQPLVQSLVQSLVHSIVQSLVHSLVRFLVQFLVRSLVQYLVQSRIVYFMEYKANCICGRHNKGYRRLCLFGSSKSIQDCYVT